MKKIALMVFALLIFATPSWANSIGNTADGICAVGQGYFTGLLVHTDGTNAVTVSVYDNTAASGTKLMSTWTVPSSTSNRTAAIGFMEKECPYSTGIYVDITTSGTVTYDCYYSGR